MIEKIHFLLLNNTEMYSYKTKHLLSFILMLLTFNFKPHICIFIQS